MKDIFVLDKTRKKLKNSLKEFYKSEKGIQKRKEQQKYMLQYVKDYKGPFKDTKPELKMEEILIFLHIPYEKQYRVGNHVADFHILNSPFLVEVDGDYWHGNPKKFSSFNKIQLGQKERDVKNEQLAKEKGFVVLRFWEDDILRNIDEVKNKLMEAFDYGK